MVFTLRGYRAIKLIGEGGLGRVYRAERVSTGGIVAVKELLDISTGSPTWNRARRELDALLRLKGHPHVINVEEVVEGPAGPCLVMEYAPGGSLFDRVQKGPLSAPELVLVGQHVCEALIASHSVGVIHRDIKPHNLLIGTFGQVKVCDFGIASLARDGEARTKTGSLTMAYASPEELDGSDEIGPAADIYSFAATMLHLASGRRPTFQDRVDAKAAGFSQNEVALAATIDLLRQALAHDPAGRPALVDLSASFDEAARRLGSRRVKVLVPPRPSDALSPGDPPSQTPTSPGAVAPTRPRSVSEAPANDETVSAATIVRPPPLAAVVPHPTTKSTLSRPLLVGLVLLGSLVIGALLVAFSLGSHDPNDAQNVASRGVSASDTTPGEVASGTPASTAEGTSKGTQATANTVRQLAFAPSTPRCGYLATVDSLPFKTCSKGPIVRFMQSQLQMLGYTVEVDCRFGPETEIAVLNLQNNAGLVVDGVVGVNTWTALFAVGNMTEYDSDGDGFLLPGEAFCD